MGDVGEYHPSFQLSLPGFHGSMDSLQTLVETHRLAPLDISMASVTAQYAEFTARSEALDLEAAGEFLRIAARLLVRKSEMLFPQADEEPEDDTPARTLSVVRNTETMLAQVRQLGQLQGRESFSSRPRQELVPRIFEPRPVGTLQRALAELRRRQTAGQVRVTAPAFVRLEVALSRLLRRLRSRTKLSLHGMLRAASRQDAVMHFLAVLELLRRRQAAVFQPNLFHDIVIERTDDGVESASRAG